MRLATFEQLHANCDLDDATFNNIRQVEQKKLFSLHWQLRTLLYLGVLLLSTGLGVLIYKNIDSIGHLAIVIAVGLGSAACLFYAFKKSSGYAHSKVESANPWVDYVVLLGALLLMSFIGYAQYQFAIFGNQYGLATFVPAVLLFVIAYYFDHLGVLSLAITTLAAWAGISITPMQLLRENDFSSDRIIWVAMFLGTALVMVSELTKRRNIKAHFEFTYKNFGFHLLMVGLCAALTMLDSTRLIWACLLGLTCFYFYHKGKQESAIYFVAFTSLYAYYGFCFLSGLMVERIFDFGFILLLFIIYIAVAVLIIYKLIQYHKQIKANARLQS
jgi:hypothetical protein